MLWVKSYVRTLIIVVVITLSLEGSVNCGRSEGDRSSDNSRLLRTVNWSLVGKPAGDLFKIVAGVPYCIGDPKPFIEMVRVHQNEFQIVATATASFPSEKPSNQHGCLGILRPLYKAVHLRTSSEDLKIFDGYTKPPKQEWPYPPERDQG